MIKRVTRTELDTLMVHLVRCPTVTLKALERLKTTDFDEATELPHKLIWGIVSEFYRKHTTMIPAQIMADKLNDLVPEVPMLADPQIQESVKLVYEACYTRIADADLVPKYALDILANFLFERHTMSRYDQERQEKGMNRQKFQELHEQSMADNIIGARVVEPFGDSSTDKITIAPRQPTGIGFLDDLIGGMRIGEAMGFLAPSGGGKTTFSNQVAISYAMQGKHVFVFTYEEPISDEYLQPVWACASRLSRSTFENISHFSQIPADKLKQFLQAKAKISNYLHYIDMSGTGGSGSGFGGVEEIETVLLEYREKGISVDAFIIDWFWPMFKRWTSTATRTFGESSGEERGRAQLCTDRIKQLCGRYKCWAWVNQQATPSEAKKKKKMEQQDSAELKSFSWYMNGCLALNTLDEDEYNGTLNYSKARSVRKGSIPIHLNGDMATFEALGSEYQYDPLQSKMLPKKTFNKTPRSRTPEQPVEPSALERNYAGQ